MRNRPTGWSVPVILIATVFLVACAQPAPPATKPTKPTKPTLAAATPASAAAPAAAAKPTAAQSTAGQSSGGTLTVTLADLSTDNLDTILAASNYNALP